MTDGSSDAKSFAALSETILRALDASGIGMTITAEIEGELRRLYTNDAGARLLGYSREEVASIPPLLPVAEDHRPRIRALYDGWRRGERHPEMLQVDLVRPDGARVPVEVGLASSSYMGIPATVAFLRDVSDRRRVEQALRTSDARFRSFAEGAPDVIAVVSEGRFAYANPAAARTLGYASVADFVSRPMSDWLPEGELARMRERIGKVLAGERLPPAEYAGRRVDGTEVTLEISSVRTEVDGKPAVLAFGRDLSERKRLQEELILADRMATVGTLAAGVAHEVNNPLTYILFNLQRIAHRLADREGSEDLREMTAVALEGAERVRVIVKDLLAFARPDTTDVGAVDVAAALRAALKLADHALRHRARVETHLDVVPPARGNSARLGQVFLNLLVNAAQSFDTDSTEDNVVRVRLARQGDAGVAISIEDNGRGIPADVVARVFDPFFTTKPAGTGTGLGLAITRSIVESFGGSVSIESAVGTGTCLTVSLPLAPPEHRLTTIHPPPLPIEEPQRRLRLLVVDDEPEVAAALRRALSRAHDVEVETDSRAALRRLLDGAAPDAILCDVMMPGLTGVDLYEEVLRARADLARRFVFMTGGPFTPKTSAFVEANERRVLRKPLDFDELRMALFEAARAGAPPVR